MSYSIKETYYTLQGEGAHTGRPAVFLRFTGCNLWTGREQDRHKAICKFCDTQFVGIDGPGGGKFTTAEALAKHVAAFWPASKAGKPYVVCTGGEPALQLDSNLVLALQALNFEVAIESNGTLALPKEIDWVCISPKANTKLIVKSGNELKLVYPQIEPEAHPSIFDKLDFEHFYLQPLDDNNQAQHIQNTIEYCLSHPQWRLSMQTHKVLGIE